MNSKLLVTKIKDYEATKNLNQINLRFIKACIIKLDTGFFIELKIILKNTKEKFGS